MHQHYPKEPRDDTVVNLNGLPAYRRRRTSPPLSVKNGLLDVCSVVPYNAYLLQRFECHLNVEVCTTLKAVKYLYKYTYKGPDRGTIEHARDEVGEFLDCRYCGVPEAAWRIFEYPLHGKSHQVVRLPVHLPQEQTVMFKAGHEQEAAAAALNKRTQLEAWFHLNATVDRFDEVVANHARTLRYHEVPRHFVWDGKTCTWQPRKQAARNGAVIGRMRHVKPVAGDLYYLRLLLLHVPGAQAKSWDDLKRAPGESGEPTFRQLALELGLLKDDADTRAMLEEGIRVAKPLPKNCELFVVGSE